MLPRYLSDNPEVITTIRRSLEEILSIINGVRSTTMDFLEKIIWREVVEYVLYVGTCGILMLEALYFGRSVECLIT